MTTKFVPGGGTEKAPRAPKGSSQVALAGVVPEVDVNSDVELTPPDIFEPVLRALHRTEFDIDPCSHELSRVPAHRKVMPPDDGLHVPWWGLVWCNPPYSHPIAWLQRCAEHDAVALVRVDTTAKWWKRYVWGRAGAVLFLQDRVGFIKPGEPGRSKAMFASALVFWRETASAAAGLGALGKAVYL